MQVNVVGTLLSYFCALKGVQRHLPKEAVKSKLQIVPNDLSI